MASAQLESTTPRLAPWGFAFLMSVLAVGVTHLVFTPYYQTNDDSGMDMLLRGVVIANKPTSFILWSNVLFGTFVERLYGLFPRLPWLRLTGIALQAGATTVLGYLVLCRGLTKARV